MTYATQTIQRQTTASQPIGVSGFIKREWAALLARRTRRATVRILRDLDDATLRDIGFGRSEIESVVYGDTDDRRVHFRAL